MAKVLNRTPRDLGIGTTVTFARAATTEITDEQLEALEESEIGQVWLREGLLSIEGGEGSAPQSREDYIRSLFERADVEMSAEGKPTVAWLNGKLPAGMARVDADERDELWEGS